MKPSFKKNLLFILASAALVFTHHLTAVIALTVISFLTLGLFFSRHEDSGFSVKNNIFLLLFFGAFLGCYFGFYAEAGLTYTLTAGDLLTAGAYQILTLSTVMYFLLKPVPGNPRPTSFKKSLVLSIVAVTLTVLCSVFVTVRSIVAGAPTLPIHYMLYLSPYFMLFPLLLLSVKGLAERRWRLLMPIFWLAPLAGLELYAVFGGSPFGLTLIVRLLNFLILPLCILFALGFNKIIDFFKGSSKQRVAVLGIAVALAAVSSVNCYSVYSSVTLQEPYMGYFWLYRLPETAACSWVSTHNVNQISVAGDAKMSYLLKDYYNEPVAFSAGLSFLFQDGSAPKLLIVYPEMATNGYVIYGGTALPLPGSFQSKLSSLNHVYSNNLVDLYGE